MRIVLGLDPGLAETGYGLVSVSGSRFAHVEHGVIRTKAGLETGKRLEIIFDELTRIIDRFHPGEAGMESLFFARNATSAIPVAQARGAILLALAKRGVPCTDYPPQAIKLAIVGAGRAEKSQVQQLVRVLLGLDEIPSPDHAADALAAAICHANTSGVLRRVK